MLDRGGSSGVIQARSCAGCSGCKSALAALQVYYVLNNPPEGWTGGKGFICAEHIQQHLPPPGPGVKVLRCGPLPMNKAMKAHLDALGYTSDMQFEF